MPPIRDLTSGGMEPFRELLASALRRARGTKSLRQPQSNAEDILSEKASSLLSKHEDFVKSTLQANGLELDTSNVSIDDIYKSAELRVNMPDESLLLSDLGTGHQSALIIHLYKQFGNSTDRDTLFLFEEPSNHLHPSTIRAIGDDIDKISSESQVLVSTHSPVLLNYLGFSNIHALKLDNSRETVQQDINVSKISDGKLRSLLDYYGLRLTEPLLARRILIVEGRSDAVILSRLIKKKYGATPDQLDVVVVPARGAHHAIKFANFVSRLDVEWRIVFDWDVAIGGQKPLLPQNISEEKKDECRESVNLLLETLNSNSRSNGIKKSVKYIRKELNGEEYNTNVYHDSKLQKFLEDKDFLDVIPEPKRAKLIDALEKKHVTKFNPILHEFNAWLWRKDIEGALIYKNNSPQLVEEVLINQNEIPNQLSRDDNFRLKVRRTLHNVNDPLTLKKVVDKLYDEGMFKRTQMNKISEWILDDLSFI